MHTLIRVRYVVYFDSRDTGLAHHVERTYVSAGQP